MKWLSEDIYIFVAMSELRAYVEQPRSKSKAATRDKPIMGSGINAQIARSNACR